MPKKTKALGTRLIIAASEQDANLYWATKFLAPDAVIFIEYHKKKYLILNDLEVDRGREQAQVDEVIRYSEIIKKLRSEKKSMTQVVAYFLKQKKVKSVAVPYNFPLAYAGSLKKQKINCVSLPDPFYPERKIKSDLEKKAIRQSLRHTGKAIQEAYRVLKESKIKGKRVYWRGKVLTSEILRGVINGYLMQHNCLGKHTIVASGAQGVDPHCQGSGPIIPHTPIIMDVFPQSMDTQYFGDMTRTVVKGKASNAVRKQWHTVKYAQEKAIKMVRAGANGKKIHTWIENYFKSQGFETGLQQGRMQGFFHGTGHGLGIEIHEAPRVSKVFEVLKVGNVITVEPGLYYQATGGVRLEDVVYVKKGGCELLSKCPKILEIA